MSGQSTIGGITQPIISQRKVEHVIQLNDGEVNMGGILEQQYTKTNSGTPFLGSIPVLKYIFSQENNEIITNEIVFLLIPRVIRGQELNDLNRRAFDVGTATGIEVHIAGQPKPASTPAAPPAAGPQPSSLPSPMPPSDQTSLPGQEPGEDHRLSKPEGAR